MFMDILAKKTMKAFKYQNKLKIEVQVKFMKMLSELLDEGFSMKDALDFLTLILDPKKKWIPFIKQRLETGERLDQGMDEAGFPKWVTSQIFLSQEHGLLAASLLSASDQLDNERKKKKELLSLLHYPLFLSIFLVGMLLAVRFILLPNFSSYQEGSSSHIAILFVYYFPHLFLVFLTLLLFLVWRFRKYQSAHSAMEAASKLAYFPFISTLFQDFYTYRFTLEWSAMMKSGLQMQEITQIMQYPEVSPLVQEIGKRLDTHYQEGKSTSEIIAPLSFLSSQLTYMIQHGESTGNLAKELEIFSKTTFENLNQKLDNIFKWIQPLLFIFIGFIIVNIYAAMLIPMFDMMEGIL